MVAVLRGPLRAALPLMLSLLASRTALADDPCTIELVGGGDPAWLAATRAIAKSSALATDTDCRRIVVVPDDDGATVLFVSEDGRQATRRIELPEELAPLVEALLVAEPRAPTAPPARPAESPSLTSTDRAQPAVDPPDRGEPAGEHHRPGAPFWVVAIGGGPKGGHADDVSPYGQVMLGRAAAHWEVGVFGRSNFEHSVALHGTEGHSRVGDVGGGIIGGRRQRVGPFTLVGGASAGLFAAWQKTERSEEHGSPPIVRESFAEPRIAVYLGGAIATWSGISLRTQIDGALAILQHRPASVDMAPFPRWTLGMTFGVEVSLTR